MTPKELAAELGIDDKRLRGWLRRTWPPAYPHQRWDLSPDQIQLVREHFAGRAMTSAAAPPPRQVLRTVVPADMGEDGWSAWVPLVDAATSAAQTPGVYMARMGTEGPVIYVGMAGERRGQGIRGRLKIYASGKGLASGLGEAVMDRALADATWLEERLAEVHEGRPRRAKEWGKQAIAWSDLHVRWRSTVDGTSALALEVETMRALPQEPLWNRRR